MDIQTTDIMIELHVPDFMMVKDFYGYLGFGVVWERKPTPEKSGYMVMRRGMTILNFWCGDDRVYNQQYFKKFAKDTPRGYATEIIIPIDGIDDYFSVVNKKYSANITFTLQEKYEHKEFRLVDPFGFYLRFVERYDWVNNRDEKGNKIKG